MVRFFVSPEEMTGDKLLLTGENAAHAKVLRLKAGETVLVCDGNGSECVCTIEECSANGLLLNVNERQKTSTEASVKVSIYMAFPKSDKLEHVIQKATELGAYEIVAFPSKPDDKSLKKKLERWQKIAASAAEQSGRGIIPQVRVLPSFVEALKCAGEAELPIMFYENEHATTLRMALEAGTYKPSAFCQARRAVWKKEKLRWQKMPDFIFVRWEPVSCAVRQRLFVGCLL